MSRNYLERESEMFKCHFQSRLRASRAARSMHVYENALSRSLIESIFSLSLSRSSRNAHKFMNERSSSLSFIHNCRDTKKLFIHHCTRKCIVKKRERECQALRSAYTLTCSILIISFCCLFRINRKYKERTMR
jgi:hypothetical protein